MRSIIVFVLYLWGLFCEAAEIGDWFVVRAEVFLGALFLALYLAQKRTPKQRTKWKEREEIAMKAVGWISLGLAIFVFFIFAPFVEVQRAKNDEEAAKSIADINKASIAEMSGKLQRANHDNETANLKLDTLALASGVTSTGGLNEKLDKFLKDFEETRGTLKELQSRVPAPARHLSEKQHDVLVFELKKAGSFEVAVRHYENQECQDYADEFIAALKEAGWKMRQPQFLISIHQSSGIFILVPDATKPTNGANQLWGALKAAGLESQGMEVKGLGQETFDLQIGFPGKIKI